MKVSVSIVVQVLGLFLISAQAIPQGTIPKCERCRFFAGIACLNLFPSEMAGTGPISGIAGPLSVGLVGSSKEAYVCIDDEPVPISEYEPEGLSQPFSESFIKVYPMNNSNQCQRSGVGHEVPQGNQAEKIAGRRVILPLGAYQTVEDTCNVVENVRPHDDFLDCVSVRICEEVAELSLSSGRKRSQKPCKETPTATPTPSPTPCETSTPTPSPTPCDTPTPTPSPTPCDTPTPTPSPSPCNTPTPTTSPTPCGTPTPSPTPCTEHPTPSPTPCEKTPTPIPTPSPTPCEETQTPSPTPCEETPSLTPSPTQKCDDHCKFSIGTGCLNFFPTDTAVTDPISSSIISVGHVDQTKEAYVCDGENYVLLSQYKPIGLSQDFSPSLFKSFGVDNRGICEMSGIGHEKLQGNQHEYLSGMKVVLPLGAYQRLNEECQVIENVHPQNDFEDCVSFEVCKGR